MKQLIYALVACFIFACTNDSSITGVPNTPNTTPLVKGISGRMVDKNGNPVKGATVTAKRVSVASGLLKTTGEIDSSTVNTDENGKFTIKVDSGTYDISATANNGQLVTFTPNILVDDDSGTTVNSTLKTPGKVIATIDNNVLLKRALAKAGIDKADGTCYISRVSPIYPTDETGACEIPGIPEGKHQLVVKFPKYIPATDSVDVKSGEVDSIKLSSITSDPKESPPTPILTELVYDTLKGTVKINWKRVNVSDLAGYIIYKSDSGSSVITQVNKFVVPDTFFVDDLYTGIGKSESNLVYKVKAIDNGSNVSDNYSNSLSIKTSHPSNYKTSMVFTIPEKPSILDTIWIKAEFINKLRNNDSINWFYNGVTRNNKFIPKDSIFIVSKDTATVWVHCSVIDAYGYKWTDSVKVVIKSYIPKITMPALPVLKASTSYVYSINTSNEVGRFIEYSWDINGDGNYDTSTTVPNVSINVRKSGKLIVKATDNYEHIIIDSVNYSALTYLTGNLTKDTILTKEFSPYYLDLTVDSGVVLHVDPGVNIILDTVGSSGLKVFGAVNFNGTVDDSINVSGYSIRGITVYNGLTSGNVSVDTITSTFKYTNFEYVNPFNIDTVSNKKTNVTNSYFNFSTLNIGKSYSTLLSESNNTFSRSRCFYTNSNAASIILKNCSEAEELRSMK